MDLDMFGIGDGENFQQTHRVLLEPIICCDTDPAIGDPVAIHQACLGAESGKQTAPLALGKLLVKLGQEHPGK
jgi:hypothetical protein